MSSLLSLDNIVGGYRHHRVFNQLSLEVCTGESIGIIGDNGVGKTTLLKAIMGLVRIESGDKRFDNQSILMLAPDAIARMGVAYVPQTNNVFKDFSVLEHFRLLGLKKKNELDKVLAPFPDLLLKKDQRAMHLSGGQRQQLAIAFAVAKQPKILLLDEPTANVQPSIIENLINVLQNHHKTYSLTILFTEQNLQVVDKLAERVFTMQNGQLT